jgi:hypothetical protein
MSDSFEIFKGKTLEDLTKDIYDNSKNKKSQIDKLIKELASFITTAEDALVIAPIIKDYFDVSIKNDEHLVKLAAVIQRHLSKSSSTSDDGGFVLTDDEKSELYNTLKDTAADLQRESDDMVNIKTQVESYATGS